MLITADQIVCHLVGDYILQSTWMATEKTQQSHAAFGHAVWYAMPFAFLGMSLPAWVFIVGTHFVIDRWRLARYLVWAKEHLAPPNAWPPPFAECAATGYPPGRPDFLSVWLLIIADNTLHLLCNGIALRWL